MAEQLAVEVDVKNVMEYTAAAAGQAPVFIWMTRKPGWCYVSPMEALGDKGVSQSAT